MVFFFFVSFPPSIFSQCYTLAIAAEPLNAVLYSNRAATTLALERFREAELDSGIAISLDKNFAKAYFRRAQARLAQGNFVQARFDALDAEKLSPGKATQELIRKIDDEIEKEKKGKDREEKKEVAVAEKEKVIPAVAVAAVPEPTQVVIDLPDAARYTGPLKAPTTAYELESTLVLIRDDSKRLGEYVSLLSPLQFPKIIGNALTEEMLALLCTGLSQPNVEPSFALALLQSLVDAPKCEMVISFLDDSIKGRFAALFSQWSDGGISVPKGLRAKLS